MNGSSTQLFSLMATTTGQMIQDSFPFMYVVLGLMFAGLAWGILWFVSKKSLSTLLK